MGLQLIFVVETNKKCKSDWIYIKDTNKEKEISSLISQYVAGNKTNQSKVIFCFDCDDYDSKPEDAEFLTNVKQYCAEKGYDFIWFCKDIERVYLGKKVDDSQKKRESATFKAKKLIEAVEECKLVANNYRANTSNIMLVIGKYLSRK